MIEMVFQIQGIIKSFGVLWVSDDVSIDFKLGEIYVIIGLNGVGKLILIK